MAKDQMLRRLAMTIHKWERRLHASFGTDITDPGARRWSLLHFEFLDHAFLRRRWHNFDMVAPGVYRSNHPNHARLAAYKARGIKTILNLRGTSQVAHHLFECESCEALGLTLASTRLRARKPAERADLLELFEHFRTLERPFLMHCKSGADRAGLASALYLLAHEGATVEQARAQLHLRYLHLRGTATGVLDHILDHYEDRLAQGQIGIEEWIATEYDPDEITRSWRAGKARAA